MGESNRQSCFAAKPKITYCLMIITIFYTSVECNKFDSQWTGAQEIYSRRQRPDILCIQESWLKPNLVCVIYEYEAIR